LSATAPVARWSYATGSTRSAHAPAVILCHGLGSDRHEVGGLFTRLSLTLADRGISTLAIDLPGHGDHPLAQEQLTVESAVTEIVAAWEWLSSQPEVDASRAGLLGFSFGGLVAVSALEKIPQLKTLVLWAPAVGSRHECFENQFSRGYPVARQLGSVTLDLGWRSWTFGRAWFQSVASARPLQILARFDGAALVVHGEQDTTVAVSASRRAVASASRARISLQLMPEADHIFGALSGDSGVASQLIELTSDWLGAQLRESNEGER